MSQQNDRKDTNKNAEEEDQENDMEAYKRSILALTVPPTESEHVDKEELPSPPLLLARVCSSDHASDFLTDADAKVSNDLEEQDVAWTMTPTVHAVPVDDNSTVEPSGSPSVLDLEDAESLNQVAIRRLLCNTAQLNNDPVAAVVAIPTTEDPQVQLLRETVRLLQSRLQFQDEQLQCLRQDFQQCVATSCPEYSCAQSQAS